MVDEVDEQQQLLQKKIIVQMVTSPQVNTMVLVYQKKIIVQMEIFPQVFTMALVRLWRKTFVLSEISLQASMTVLVISPKSKQ